MEIYSFRFSGFYYNVILHKGGYVSRAFFSLKPSGRLISTLTNDNVLNLLLKYFKGSFVDFMKIPILLMNCTKFEYKVYNIIRTIPYGEVKSYKWVAEKLGNPHLYRVVGNILARNPILIIIPCHRVVRSDGTLGGYSSVGGVTLKKKLLRLEGLDL